MYTCNQQNWPKDVLCIFFNFYTRPVVNWNKDKDLYFANAEKHGLTALGFLRQHSFTASGSTESAIVGLNWAFEGE